MSDEAAQEVLALVRARYPECGDQPARWLQEQWTPGLDEYVSELEHSLLSVIDNAARMTRDPATRVYLLEALGWAGLCLLYRKIGAGAYDPAPEAVAQSARQRFIDEQRDEGRDDGAADKPEAYW